MTDNDDRASLKTDRGDDNERSSVLAIVAAVVGLVAVLCLAASPAVSATEQSGDGPNLLLITIDTLRADRIGVYGAENVDTPAIDRVAGQGVRFDQATTTAPLTLPAHASILTGQNPYRHGVRDNHNFRLADDILTLAEVLGGAGYDTGGFIGSWVLNADTGIAQGFDTYTRFDDDTIARLTTAGFEAQRRGALVAAEAIPWLIGRPDKFFAWVHLFDPHLPYDPPPPYSTRYAGRPYDGEVAYVDEVVGGLMRALETAGLADDTIVAIVADHGEGFGDHGEQRHSFFIYDEITRVPMIVRAPGMLPGGTVVSAQVSVVDLMPTLLQLMGVADPQASTRDGVDLAPLVRSPDAAGHAAYSESIIPLVEFGWSELRSLRQGGYKYISAPRPELYELGTDPAEGDNIVATDTDRTASMREALAALTAGDDLDSMALGERFVSAVRTEQLRALGYLGGGGVATGNRDDPKDHVALFEAYQDGVRDVGRALQDGDWASAEASIGGLETLLPDHHLTHYYRGRLLVLRGDSAAAIAALETSRRLGPAHTLAYTDLAAAYRLTGDNDRSREVLTQAMAAFPDLVVFPLLLGSHYHQDGLLNEALATYLRARAIDPRNVTLLRNLGQLYLMRAEFDSSVRTFETLIEVLPNDVDAWLRYGLALEARGDLPGADTVLARAMELAPRNPQAMFHRARVAAKDGRTQDAVTLLQQALEIDPDYAEARTALQGLIRGS